MTTEADIQREIETGFRQWLDIFMGAEIERWSRLSVWECDVLIDRCWINFWANVQYHNGTISVGKFLSITQDIEEEE